MALTIKNKKGFVDGILVRPLNNPDEQNQWDRCNMLVKTWLLTSMSKSILDSVIHCGSTRSMWIELQERFSHTNIVSLYNIENEIHDCEQGNTSVTSFFTKLKELWDAKDSLCSFPPCSCEAASSVKEYLETQKTIKLLMGLGESFPTTRSNFIAMDPLPSLNKAYVMALKHANQAEAITGKATTPPETTAFTVKKYETKCTKCNRDNHLTKNCSTHRKCTYRKWNGHTYEQCKKRKTSMMEDQTHSTSNYVSVLGEHNEGTPTLQLSKEKCVQLLGLLAKAKSASSKVAGKVTQYEELSGKVASLFNSNKETMWIIDSEARDHIACDSSLFTSTKLVHKHSVKLPSGSLICATHMGTITFSDQLVLKCVLYVP